MTVENELNRLIESLPALKSCIGEVREATDAITSCFENRGKLLICGNGGSCADADHIVGELMKSFEKKRPLTADLKNRLQIASPERGSYIAEHLQRGLPAISLCAHGALVSAFSNDVDADLVFAQQVEGYGNPGDLLLAITTSGNSINVVDAAITAKAKGMTVIGMTGQSGGRLKAFCDITICVPAKITSEVQEYHMPVYHAICKCVEDHLF
ncbi:MAG: SIS domain-containing protein [Bacteroidota bacterium]